MVLQDIDDDLDEEANVILSSKQNAHSTAAAARTHDRKPPLVASHYNNDNIKEIDDFLQGDLNIGSPKNGVENLCNPEFHAGINGNHFR